MERVEVMADKELSRYYPGCWAARVDATLQSGRTVSSLVLDAPGDPSRAFDVGQVREKFHRYADPAIGRTAADELASACLAAIENEKALAKIFDWVNA
jgi:2-methylcitrate dehydratase PrpD